MKRIIDYETIITEAMDLDGDNTLPSLLVQHDGSVQEYIRKGWQPFGPLQLQNVGTYHEHAIQVMVKYADDEQYD